MTSAQFEQLQAIHVAAWNEKDNTKRYELLLSIYAENIQMHDKDNTFDGLQAISDFIGKLIAEDPSYHFTAVKTIEPLQNSARLFGQIKTSGPLRNSMDFFLLENGKVKQLYAFLEQANA